MPNFVVFNRAILATSQDKVDIGTVDKFIVFKNARKTIMDCQAVSPHHSYVMNAVGRKKAVYDAIVRYAGTSHLHPGAAQRVLAHAVGKLEV